MTNMAKIKNFQDWKYTDDEDFESEGGYQKIHTKKKFDDDTAKKYKDSLKKKVKPFKREKD